MPVVKSATILEQIGNTPLVRLEKMEEKGSAAIYAKVEAFNPGGSIKDRICLSMIEKAEADGCLKPGATVVEPTSGNTGIGLSMVCAVKGYKLILTMPDTMTIERRRLLTAYGADLVLTPGAQGMRGAVQKAEELATAHGYLMPQQFKNPANPEIHFKTTGPEIWDDTDGKVDILVSGVGTGGTITGVSRYIEQVRKKPLWSIAVEPVESPVLTAVINGQPPKPGPHKIQGIGAGFKPDVLDMAIVDEVLKVTSDESIEMTHRLHKEEGITAGISSGAAVAAAVKAAAKPENKGKLIVVILPDAGDRYHSSVLFQSISV